jgi:hypothetical protein
MNARWVLSLGGPFSKRSLRQKKAESIPWMDREKTARNFVLKITNGNSRPSFNTDSDILPSCQNTLHIIKIQRFFAAGHSTLTLKIEIFDGAYCGIFIAHV